MDDRPTHRPTSQDEHPPTNSSPPRRSILASTAAIVASAGCLTSPFSGGGSGDTDGGDDEPTNNESSSTEPPDEGESPDETDAGDEGGGQEGDGGGGEEDDTEEEDESGEVSLATYENQAYGYQIGRPDSWDLEQDDDRAMAFADPGGDAELTIDVYLAEGDPSLEDGADMLITNTEDEMDDVNVRDRQQGTLDSGDDAVRLELDYTHPERGELRSLHRIVAIDHVLYAAEFAVPVDSWQQNEDLAEAVITSLEIPDPPSESVTADELEQRETYEGDGFSIEYPAEWDVDERDSGAVRIQSGEARAGMVVATEPSQKQPLEDLVQAYRDDLELNPDAEIVDERDGLQVANGNDAHLLVADLDDPDGKATTFGLTTVDGGTAYYVTFEIPKATHTTAVEEVIVQILTSLSF